MEVSEDAQEEMDAGAMAVRVAVVAAPTHTAQQGLSIIPITMDTVKQDITQIGTQILVASLAPTAQMATLVTPKSSLVEMETEDPMSSSLSILPALSNIKTDMMSSF
jgi:polysaccharide pyruvyl transferase WcaK-like protein